jgi:hypothetical protein
MVLRIGSTLGRRSRACSRLLIWGLFVAPVCALGQSVAIGTGDRWQSDDAVIDFDCASLNVSGQLDAANAQLRDIHHFASSGQITAGSASIAVGGDWSQSGSFASGSSTVRFADHCGEAVSAIIGSTSFANLNVTSSRAKAYIFESGQTQSVSSSLTLAGAPGQHLLVRTSQAGVHSDIALVEGGAQNISWIDVADMRASADSAWLAPAPAVTFNAIDSGNNARWFERLVPRELPSGSTWTMILMTLGLASLAMRHRRLGRACSE